MDPIIDINITRRRKRESIREYQDRVIIPPNPHEHQTHRILSFATNQIHVHDTSLTRHYTHYAQRTFQQRKLISGKFQKQHIHTRILSKWQNRKLEHEATALQEAAGDNDYNPIWKYRK